MKIVRVPLALAFALLAALPPLAAALPSSGKPVAAGDADSDRDGWRGRAVAMCVSDLGSLDGVTPDEREATCGCTIDRFMAGKRTEDLPAFSPRDYRLTVGSGLLSCAATQRTAVVTAVARHLADAPIVRDPQAALPAEGKPTDTQDQGPAATRPDRPLPDFGTWLSSLSLPAWVTNSGLPSWAWAILATIAFLVLRGLRRGGDQRDLIGPPPSTRFGAKANTPTPRRPDPPQRG